MIMGHGKRGAFLDLNGPKVKILGAMDILDGVQN
jgi:hypothetical protein